MVGKIEFHLGRRRSGFVSYILSFVYVCVYVQSIRLDVQSSVLEYMILFTALGIYFWPFKARILGVSSSSRS